MVFQYNLQTDMEATLHRAKKISPSLLAADFGNLVAWARLVEAAGADSLHLDVVDGHFAPNFAFGPDAVAAIRKVVRIPLVVHLEIDCPDKFLEPFAQAGADIIFFHPEESAAPLRAVETIKRLGKIPGFSVLPSTPVASLEEIIDAVPVVVFLCVPPGFGGASLDPGVYQKLRQARKLAQRLSHDLEITVDGGVNLSNAPALATAGADVFVCGTYIFDSPDPQMRIQALREAIQTMSDS